MRRSRVLGGALFVSSIAIAVAASTAACSDDDPVTPAGDSGVPETSAADTGSTADTSTPKDTGTDTGPIAVRCTDADFDAPCNPPNGGACTSLSEIEVSFNLGAAPLNYTNRCVKVKAGTVIAFTGSFFQHPLEPYGGDTPNPVPLTQPKTAAEEPAAGDAGKPEIRVTVSAEGTFGYQCIYHPIQMFGAIRVVP